MHWHLEDDLARQLEAYGLGKYAAQGAAMAIIKGIEAGVKNKTPRTNAEWSDKDCILGSIIAQIVMTTA